MDGMRTVGVEEEVLLVDGQEWKPTPAADDVLRWGGRVRGSRAPSMLTREMHQEMLELVSRPHTKITALRDEVVANRSIADALAAFEGVRVGALASAPTTVLPHPTRSERYDRIMERYGALPRHSLNCGLHVHVSIESEDEGVAVLDRIRTWTPLLIALSANSPFNQGEDTGHASYRSLDWNQWPSAGPMERFGSVQRYRSVERMMLRTGALLDEGMLYLDSRLSRAFPTVEVRVADVPLEASSTAMIAAIVRALVDTAARSWREGAPAPDVPACAIRLANWRAALEGIRGQLVDPMTFEEAPAQEVIGLLLAHVMPALHANGDDQAVEHTLARLLARGTGADQQRSRFARDEDFAGVVEEAVRCTHLSHLA
jgi:carboxylate-amine ligase